MPKTELEIEDLKLMALEGKLEEIKEHYPKHIDAITDDFYETLINHLTLTKKWGPIQNQMLDILDYLNEVDPKYKRFILRASKENKYTLSPMAFQRFTTGPASKEFFESCKISLLFRIFSENKLPLFIRLLKQGVPAQTWGLQLSLPSYPLENLFYSIICYSPDTQPDYLEYLKELMPYIPDPNQTLTPEALATVTLDDNPFPITTLCSKPNTQGLKLVLPKAHLRHIAFQIIHLSQGLHTKVQLAHTYVLSFQNKTKKEADIYSESLSSLFLMMPIRRCYTAYIFHSGSSTCYKQINLLTEAASEKLNTLSLEDFDKEYTALFSLAHQKLSQNQSRPLASQENDPIPPTSYKNEAFYMLLGCEYLLMTYATLHFKKLPILEHEKFLQQRAVPLYTKLIAVLEQCPHLPQQKDLIQLYTLVRDRFAAPLLETSPPPVIMHPQAPSSPKAPVPESPAPQDSTFECKGPR